MTTTKEGQDLIAIIKTLSMAAEGVARVTGLPIQQVENDVTDVLFEDGVDELVADILTEYHSNGIPDEGLTMAVRLLKYRLLHKYDPRYSYPIIKTWAKMSTDDVYRSTH